MKGSLYRPYAVVGALLLSACLENLTVGRETQPLAPLDAGALPPDAALVAEDGAVNDAGGVSDAGGGPIDAGPCTPADCQALQDPVQIQRVPTAQCATGEELICARGESGLCGLQCPPVPADRQCNSPIQIAPSDGGVCGPDQYCRFDIQGCGGGIGACTPIPTSCEPLSETICGCDGQTYPNLCSLAQAGVSPKSVGPCPP